LITDHQSGLAAVQVAEDEWYVEAAAWAEDPPIPGAGQVSS